MDAFLDFSESGYVPSKRDVITKSGEIYSEGHLTGIMFREPRSGLVYRYSLATGKWYHMRPEQAPLRGSLDDLPIWRENGTPSVPSTISTTFKPSERSTPSRSSRIVTQSSVESLAASFRGARQEDPHGSRSATPPEHLSNGVTVSSHTTSVTITTKKSEVNDLAPGVPKRSNAVSRASRHAQANGTVRKDSEQLLREDLDTLRRVEARILARSRSRSRGRPRTRESGFFRLLSQGSNESPVRQREPRRRRPESLPELQMSCYRVLKKVKENEYFHESRPMPERPKLTFGQELMEKCRRVKQFMGELGSKLSGKKL
ncbi:hypothetical protein LIA77_11674 [Sarocladium implicatum]|nr:hypothetical protein LIA77_11674 [Sarocladium implicatum]